MKTRETKFGTYTEMETENSTKISTDKLGVFIERLKKLGIEVKLSGNFPWVYINEICGIRVTERFEANHGFTVMFLPGRNDSPPSEFTDITEIFKLIRKYKVFKNDLSENINLLSNYLLFYFWFLFVILYLIVR